MPLSLADVFDSSYYLTVNPEVKDLISQGQFQNELEHFEAIGIDQGLRFSPYIDIAYYKTVANPDLTSLSNGEALDHLLHQGIDEGRIFSPFIDLDYYRQVNSLSSLTNSDALLDLITEGLEAGLPFSPDVNLPEFRGSNPTLANQSLDDAFIELATYGFPLDEGRVRMGVGEGQGLISIPDEYLLGEDTQNLDGEIILTYSKSNNTVEWQFNFSGLPYKLDATRPEDVSTPYNQQPVSVEDGAWQLWLINRLGTVPTNYWYDGATGQLIGNEYDLFDSPLLGDTPTDINNDGILDQPRSIPSTHMVESPLFEGNPDGTGNLTYTTNYDKVLDPRGTGGTYVAFLPYVLDDADTVGVYYTEGGLPVSQAMDWDDVIADVRNGVSPLSVALSLEPNPKPEYLLSRDNTMIGAGLFYPNRIPEGIVNSVATNSYRFAEPIDFTNHATPPWPWRQNQQQESVVAETVFGSLYPDVIEVNGSNQLIFGGAEDDLIDASVPLLESGDISNEGFNRIYADSGNDTVILGTGDRIFGNDDDDRFFVTAGGNNTITGGEGADQFWIATAEIPEVANTITDFTSGEDVIGIAGLGVSFEELEINNNNGDALIAFNGNNLAILSNVDAASLVVEDFSIV